MPEQDLQSMQQEAIRRVREMQSRAQQAQQRSSPQPSQTRNTRVPIQEPHTGSSQADSGHGSRSHPQTMQGHAQNTPPQAHQAEAEEQSPMAAQEHKKGNPITNIFDTLMSDGERSLILVLLLLLAEEKTDTGLLFALMYLII